MFKLGWQVNIWVSKGADYRNIPSQRLASLPRNKSQSIRALAVSSCQAAWLLGHWDASCYQGSCYTYYYYSHYPAPDSIGDRVLFSIDFFVYLFLCLFVCFFVSKITRKWLDWFAWNFQWRRGLTMGQPDYIFSQFQETVQYRNAQHGGGVCCTFAPQLVIGGGWYCSCCCY